MSALLISKTISGYLTISKHLFSRQMYLMLHFHLSLVFFADVQILYDLLFPASADARLAQHVAHLSSSSCLPRKVALVDTQAQASPPSLQDQKEVSPFWGVSFS